MACRSPPIPSPYSASAPSSSTYCRSTNPSFGPTCCQPRFNPQRLRLKDLYRNQCCGSICFWASWIILSLSKNRKKNIDSYCFVTFFDFLSLKNYVNVPSKSITQNNLENENFFVDVLKVTDEISRIRIRIYLSEVWIRGSESVPKFHGSATLIQTSQCKKLLICWLDCASRWKRHLMRMWIFSDRLPLDHARIRRPFSAHTAALPLGSHHCLRLSGAAATPGCLHSQLQKGALRIRPFLKVIFSKVYLPLCRRKIVVGRI